VGWFHHHSDGGTSLSTAVILHLFSLAINSPDLVNPFHSGRYWFHTADWLAKL